MKLNVASHVYGKRVEGLKVAIKRGLISAAAHAVSDIQGVVIPSTLVLERNGFRKAPPVDRGVYKAGWRSEETIDGARIFHANPRIAAIMEYGVRAGNVKISRAMIRALTSWSKRKGLDADPKRKDPQSIAWAVAKNMQRYGIAGRHVLKRESERLALFARKEVMRAVAKHIEETKQ